MIELPGCAEEVNLADAAASASSLPKPAAVISQSDQTHRQWMTSTCRRLQPRVFPPCSFKMIFLASENVDDGTRSNADRILPGQVNHDDFRPCGHRGSARASSRKSPIGLSGLVLP